MGSNQNRHGDKYVAREWGSKARKEEAHSKRRQADLNAIEDELDPRPTPGGKRHKKDTKRWCRGKVGREHDYEFIERAGRGRWAWREYRCKGCQRKKYDWKR
jgi:hypothetical protein